MSTEKVSRQEIVVDGDALVSTIKELLREADVKGIIHEGNIRRVIIQDEEGKTLIEVPLTWGVIGAIAAPALAAIGAIGALAGKVTIVVEKREEEEVPGPDVEQGPDL